MPLRAQASTSPASSGAPSEDGAAYQFCARGAQESKLRKFSFSVGKSQSFWASDFSILKQWVGMGVNGRLFTEPSTPDTV